MRTSKNAYEIPSKPGEKFWVRYNFDEVGFILHGLYNEERECLELTESDYDFIEDRIREEENRPA